MKSCLSGLNEVEYTYISLLLKIYSAHSGNIVNIVVTGRRVTITSGLLVSYHRLRTIGQVGLN